MSEHPLDSHLRQLIDDSHAQTQAFVELANIISGGRRLVDELSLRARITDVIRIAYPSNGGSINEVTGQVSHNGSKNGAHANGSNGLAYTPQVQNGSPEARYSLKQALQAAAVEQTPYPEETTYPGVPAQYAKTYGYK